MSAGGEGLGERVKEITGGRGAYAAIECIGGDTFAQVGGGGVGTGWLYRSGWLS